LRHILRQDPDKILIGEIRDKETADIAVKFSLTGHLVFTTLHANDAPSTITRLLDIGMPRYLTGSVTNLIMAQRLVRTICSACKYEYPAAAEELTALRLEPDKHKGTIFCKGKGCVRCRKTGFYGRTALFELMEMRLPIRKVIFEGKNEDDLRLEAIKGGMVTLREAGIRKVIAGTVSAEEVLKKTVNED
jgi:type IV pilus assembly protein PilB